MEDLGTFLERAGDIASIIVAISAVGGAGWLIVRKRRRVPAGVAIAAECDQGYSDWCWGTQYRSRGR